MNSPRLVDGLGSYKDISFLFFLQENIRVCRENCSPSITILGDMKIYSQVLVEKSYLGFSFIAISVRVDIDLNHYMLGNFSCFPCLLTFFQN